LLPRMRAISLAARSFAAFANQPAFRRSFRSALHLQWPLEVYRPADSIVLYSLPGAFIQEVDP